MAQRLLIRRLQRACRRGESVQKIAEKERIAVRTVRRMTSTPQFQRTLAVYFMTKALTQPSPTDRTDELAGRTLARLLSLIGKGVVVKFTSKDIAILGAFSHQQLQQATPSLGES